jgi:hypothetical protein
MVTKSFCDMCSKERKKQGGIFIDMNDNTVELCIKCEKAVLQFIKRGGKK